MYRYAMVGYYPSGVVYAVGSGGVTPKEARERAAREDLESYQVFPLERQPPRGGHHGFYRRNENDEYKRGQSREFAAQLTPYVAKLIEKDKAD